jgi:hypothetical protein
MASPWERFQDNAVPNTNTPPTLGDNRPWERFSDNRRSAPSREERRDYFINRGPIERFTTQSRGMAQRIPIVGNFVSTTPEMREEERMLPISTEVGRSVGGMAGTVPMVAALPMTGGIARQMAISGPAGGALNLADAYTSDNPPEDAQEAMIRGLFGTAAGVAGPLFGRVLAPSGVKPPTRPQPNLPPPPAQNGTQLAMQWRARNNPQPPPPANNAASNMAGNYYASRNANQQVDTLGRVLTQGLAGGSLGYIMTGDPMHAITGASVATLGPAAVRKYANSSVGKSHLGVRLPEAQQSILNAILMQRPTEYNDSPPVD